MSWNTHWTVQADAAKINAGQQYRRKLILENLEIKHHGSGAKIIDFGSGIGCLLVDLQAASPCATVIGIDRSYTGLVISSNRLPKGLFVCQDLSDSREIIGNSRGIGTHAVCSEVLEHVDDPINVLRNIRRYLISGAMLIVTVPSGPMSAFDVHIGHLRHFTGQSLRNLLLDAGFENITIKQYGFPFFDLYRIMVVMAGKRIISQYERSPTLSTRALMTLLRWSFRLNESSGRKGLQLVARAYVNK